MSQPIQGFGTCLFLLSPGRDGHTYPDIDQCWDSSGGKQEALQNIFAYTNQKFKTLDQMKSGG
uniref:Uncharacterized protein n=1 Tax=Romanomermis culicivorax TaxID=13658 RepID=A0A915L9Z4_ROMCU